MPNVGNTDVIAESLRCSKQTSRSGRLSARRRDSSQSSQTPAHSAKIPERLIPVDVFFVEIDGTFKISVAKRNIGENTRGNTHVPGMPCALGDFERLTREFLSLNIVAKDMSHIGQRPQNPGFPMFLSKIIDARKRLLV